MTRKCRCWLSSQAVSRKGGGGKRNLVLARKCAGGNQACLARNTPSSVTLLSCETEFPFGRQMTGCSDIHGSDKTVAGMNGTTERAGSTPS